MFKQRSGSAGRSSHRRFKKQRTSCGPGAKAVSLPWLRRLSVEPLEQRTLLSATFQFDHIVYGSGGSTTPPSTAFTPDQIKAAYGIDRITDLGIRQEGAGQTIAIIEAYDNPEFVGRNSNADVSQDGAFLTSDLHKFDETYGLPEPAGFFTKVDQRGGTNYPVSDTGWGTEIALDVEWVHAIAPLANIILVEADSASVADLLDAAAWARDYSGASVITMTFGTGEEVANTAIDSIFHSSADRGITWVASTGNGGATSVYPATSPNVVAVGGTTLVAPGGVYSSEIGWSGSGGGISAYESQPSYQQGLVIHDGSNVVDQSGMRAVPDVSFDADPSSGVAVYDSFAHGTSAPWVQVGGTSLSAAAWGGLVAITNQVRANHGLPSLDGATGTLPNLYDSYNFHDIVVGNNGYAAATGYDLVTGIGTPMADILVRELAGVALTVGGTTPSRGSIVAAPPSSYVTTFSFPIDPTSLQPADLTVNGIPATSVTLSADGMTATFTYDSNPVAGEGLQAMTIAGDAITKLDDPATSIEPFSTTFRYDAELLQVTSTSPASGSILTLPGPLTCDVTFNEPIAPASVTASSLVLSGIPGATVTGVTLLSGDTTARFTIDGLAAEGTLVASIAAGAVTDQFGNPGEAFVVSYSVDSGTVSFPGPAMPLAPTGSLIYYTPTVSAIISPGGDTDTFVIDIDPGQTISVLVTSTDAGFQPTLQVLDPNDAVLRTATAGAAGQNVLAQTLPIAIGGTYTVVVSGAAGTSGSYNVVVALNAALEEESSLSGVNNDDLASAQPISESFIDLTSSATMFRGAVVGANADDATTLLTSADFESGQTGYVIDNSLLGTDASAGLWHLSTRHGAEPNHSSTASFYYGSETTGTYDTGAANAGSITSPMIALPAVPSISLSFNYILQTESDLDWDSASVLVSDNGFATSTTIASRGVNLPNSSTWTNFTADLSAFAGKNVQIRFVFNTVDGDLNAYEGWYVDDIQVSTPTQWIDYYSVLVNSGDTVRVGLKNLAGTGTTCTLLDGSGSPLESSWPSSTNLDQMISDVYIPFSAKYYIRVTGTVAATYDLIITTNVTFDNDSNHTLATAQPLSIVGDASVLGYIGQTTSGVEPDDYPAGAALTNAVPGIRLTALGGSGAVTSQTSQFTSTGTKGFANGTDTYWSDTVFLRADFASPVSSVSIDLVPDDSEDPGFLRAYNSAGTLLQDLETGIPPYPGFLTMTISRPTADIAYIIAGGQSGQVMLLDHLVVNGGAGSSDYYSVYVDAGKSLTISTTTPGDGPGEFVNTLDPKLELYDPSGTLVAANTNSAADGRNACLVFNTLASGTYKIRVMSEANAGAYLLTASVGVVVAMPDLAVTKTHTGNFRRGEQADTYTITVSNLGTGPTTGTVSLTDVLPTGLTATDFSGAGWTTDLSTLTASRSDVLSPGESYPALTLTVRVAADAPSSVTNTVTVSSSGDLNTLNDTAADTTVIMVGWPIITGTTPSLATGKVGVGATTLALTFNQAVTGAGDVANYELRSLGTDGLLGTSDDAIVPLSASYSGTTATLTFPALAENVYRLTVRDAIIDTFGVNLDGNEDGIPGGNWLKDFVTVVGISGGGLFPSVTTFTAGASQWEVTTGDFNGDGKVDLATSNGSSTVGILLGNGSGGFSAPSTFSLGSVFPTGIVSADFNRDGILDVLVTNEAGSTLLLLLGKGNGTFSAPKTFSSGDDNPLDAVVADFNADGNLDVAVTCLSKSSVAVLLGDGQGGFSAPTVLGSGGTSPYGLAVGDFNADGTPDLAVANVSGAVGILLGDGSGGFSGPTPVTYSGASPVYVAVGDFNNDAKLDLAVTNLGHNTVSVLLGNGDGSFGAGASFTSGGTMPVGILACDFNSDGNTDIAATNYGSNTVGVLLGNGDGTFAAVTTSGSGGSYPTGLAAADFNGDGQPDLAAANAQSTVVGVLLNQNITSWKSLTSVHGLPFDIALGAFGAGELLDGSDNAFDGDGRLIVDGTPFQPGSLDYDTADDGQSFVTANGTVAGLTVSRKITVPNTGNEDFARTVDVFQNTTGSDITTTVTIVGNLGSDAATTVFATSDGDTIVETTDQWIGTDGGAGTPAVIHYIHGPLGLQPSSVDLIGDNIQWTYSITVHAGQTVRLAYFTIVDPSEAAAMAAANSLVTPSGFGAQAATFLTLFEVRSLLNFATMQSGDLSPPEATRDIPFENTVLFHFTDTSPLADTGDYTATITWGDGETSTVGNVASVDGQIVRHNPSDLSQGFDVLGSHTYVSTLSGATFAVQVNGSYGTLEASEDNFSVTDGQHAVIEGRHIFYNNSAFDGNTPAADPQDDNAIAPENADDPLLSKVALLPGHTATFQNYTNYSRGINGIMVDLSHVSGPISASDFEFRVGNSSTPDTWDLAPAPLSITVREVGGVRRVTIIWADDDPMTPEREAGSISKEWLQVTVKATENTDLATDEVFYYGNAVGDVGNSEFNAMVNATDEIEIRNHPAFVPPATLDSRYDLNRDRKVNATDQIIARANTTFADALILIEAPAATIPGEAVAGATVWVDAVVTGATTDATLQAVNEGVHTQRIADGQRVGVALWPKASDVDADSLRPRRHIAIEALLADLVLREHATYAGRHIRDLPDDILRPSQDESAAVADIYAIRSGPTAGRSTVGSQFPASETTSLGLRFRPRGIPF